MILMFKKEGYIFSNSFNVFNLFSTFIFSPLILSNCCNNFLFSTLMVLVELCRETSL